VASKELKRTSRSTIGTKLNETVSKNINETPVYDRKLRNVRQVNNVDDTGTDNCSSLTLPDSSHDCFETRNEGSANIKQTLKSKEINEIAGLNSIIANLKMEMEILRKQCEENKAALPSTNQQIPQQSLPPIIQNQPINEGSCKEQNNDRSRKNKRFCSPRQRCDVDANSFYVSDENSESDVVKQSPINKNSQFQYMDMQQHQSKTKFQSNSLGGMKDSSSSTSSLRKKRRISFNDYNFKDAARKINENYVDKNAVLAAFYKLRWQETSVREFELSLNNMC